LTGLPVTRRAHGKAQAGSFCFAAIADGHANGHPEA